METFPNQISKLDLGDLRLFIKVAQEKSVTRGAESAFLSVPAASQRIKHLEEMLGAKLLLRTARGVSLTEEGTVLLSHARAVLEQVRRLHSEFQSFTGGVRGHLRLFANTGSIAELLPVVLGKFLGSHPGITVDLQLGHSLEVVRAVAQGMADIGVISGSVRAEGLETLPYSSGRLVLAIPADEAHPLSRVRSIRFADSLEYDYVGLDRSSALHLFLQSEAAQLGRTLRLRIQVDSFETMSRLIEANVGVGVIPEMSARRLAKSTDIRIVELTDPWATFELRICVRRLADLPSFAQQLVEFMLHSAKPAARPASTGS